MSSSTRRSALQNDMPIKYLIFAFTVLLASSAFAAKVKTVEATYVYHAPSNQSPDEAMKVALERAKLQAITDEFGTLISQENTTRLENTAEGQESKSQTSFFSYSASDVKGEWLETIGKPQCNIEFADGMMVVTVTVKGKARELTSAQVNFIAEPLRNHPERADMATEFKDGNDLYLYFRSPIDGYVAVYLLPGDGEAFCLLPYQRVQSGVQQVKANCDYVFFSVEKAPQAEKALVDEYVLTASRAVEHNVLYVLFSKQPFYKASDSSMEHSLPRSLSEADFLKWLGSSRLHDLNLQLKKIPLTITR